MKKILTFILVVYGLVFIIAFIVAKSEDINFIGNEPSVNEKASQESQNSILKENELLLVNNDHGLSKDYKPKKLTIPNIPFASEVDREEKHVAGIIVDPLEEWRIFISEKCLR
jgi:zinc D-Ala-D-Ala carboxypeptidase